MIAYKELQESNAWDTRWDIPAVPIHLNPSIYTAYAVRILSATDADAATLIRMRYEEKFLLECEKSSGLLTTLPGSGTASHDDMYGAAYLSERFAGRSVDYLTRTDGVYREKEPTVFRFLFLMPAVKAFAGFKVGLWSQIQFSIHCMFHLMTAKDGQTSDHLMIWLAIPHMRRFTLSRIFIDLWASRWTKLGMTPKNIFSEVYLREVPWFGKFASEDWNA